MLSKYLKNGRFGSNKIILHYYYVDITCISTKSLTGSILLFNSDNLDSSSDLDKHLESKKKQKLPIRT